MDLSQYDSSTFAVVGGGGTRFADMNAGITPVFFRKAEQNFKKTEEEGHPIFEEFEFVRLFVAGDPFNLQVNPVDDAMKKRFAREYKEFLETAEKSQHVDGTPLRQWPLITPVKIAEFEGLNIFNVEGLAAIADVHLARSLDLREWREKARAWLEQAKSGAAAARYAAENERLRGDVADLRAQLAEQGEQIKRLMAKAQETAGEARRRA